MAYTPATKLPALLYAQWGRPTAPNPRLASPVAAGISTLVFTAPLLDHTGSVPTRGFRMGVRDSVTGYVELMYVPPNGLSADGLTATGVVRGCYLEGEDYTTGDATLSIDLGQDSSVRVDVDPVLFNLMIDAMQGSIATGGASWKIGNAIDEAITVYAYNADANKPYFQYDPVTNQWVFSNNGVSSTPFGTGAGVTGGAGISVSAGVISINLADTSVFVSSSSGAADVGKIARLNASGQLPTGFVNAIPASSFTAKGDLLVGTGAGTFAALTVGANGTVPQADSSQTSGIKWGSVPLSAGNFANGKSTRPNDQASGTLVIPHGMSTAPTTVITQAVTIAAAKLMLSSGSWKSGTENAIGSVSNFSTTTAYTINDTVSIYVEGSVGNAQKATITVDATNITYTFVKSGTGAGAGANIEILWQAFA